MASVDADAIMNFETGYRRAAMDFNSSEFLWFSDYNNNSYSSQILKFDTLTAKDQFWVPADSYLMIPLTIQAVGGGGANPAYRADDPIAFKNSILSLITGIQILSGSGQTLVNDQSIQYINAIRRLLDTSWEAQQTNMNELQLWKDTSLPVAVGGFTADLGYWSTNTNAGTVGWNPASNQPNQFIDGGYPAGAASGFISTNPRWNQGFENRIKMFKSNCTYLNGVFSTTVFIPLRYIHPFFEKLDFPIINTRFQINFYTCAQATNATTLAAPNTPILHGLNNSNVSGVAVVMLDAVCNVASQTYIYYRKVTYTPEQTAKVGQLIASGHKIVLEYPSMDFYPSISVAGGYAAGASGVTLLVSPSTVAPLRIWQLLLPYQYVSGNLATMQQQPFQTNAYLTRGNVLINSQRYYDNDLGNNGGLTFLHDFWEVFDEQTVGHGFKENLGSLIGLNDFANIYNFNCYDVSRLRDRLPNPSEAVNIQVQFTVGPALANAPTVTSESIFIVERNTVAEFVFSNGAVSIAIGSQSS